jgi:hypothetical protein
MKHSRLLNSCMAPPSENKAYASGAIREWWPDWKGECAAIVGCGPSVKSLDLSILKLRIHVIAIKTAIDLCPWADVCYGCDAPWWIDRKGLPNFKGLKFHHGLQARDSGKDLIKVEIDISRDTMLVEEPLKLGNGGCSGFQALNLAVQFGASDVILIGFDLHERGGLHYYGRNKWPYANNPMCSNFNRWARGFEKALPSLKALGVYVVNASLESELQCFDKKPLNEIMRDWGL